MTEQLWKIPSDPIKIRDVPQTSPVHLNSAWTWCSSPPGGCRLKMNFGRARPMVPAHSKNQAYGLGRHTSHKSQNVVCKVPVKKDTNEIKWLQHALCRILCLKRKNTCTLHIMFFLDGNLVLCLHEKLQSPTTWPECQVSKTYTNKHPNTSIHCSEWCLCNHEIPDDPCIVYLYTYIWVIYIHLWGKCR